MRISGTTTWHLLRLWFLAVLGGRVVWQLVACCMFFDSPPPGGESARLFRLSPGARTGGILYHANMGPCTAGDPPKKTEAGPIDWFWARTGHAHQLPDASFGFGSAGSENTDQNYQRWWVDFRANEAELTAGTSDGGPEIPIG